MIRKTQYSTIVNGDKAAIELYGVLLRLLADIKLIGIQTVKPKQEQTHRHQVRFVIERNYYRTSNQK